MKTRIAQWIGCFLVSFCFVVGPPFGSAADLTVDDIVEMLNAKLPEQVVLTRIESQGEAFDLSTDDLVRLKEAGASEKVMLLMMDPNASSQPEATGQASSPSGPFEEPGVYYKKQGKWMEMLPEIVNWKTGGVLKNVASAGIVKKDVNGNLPGPHSRNSVTTPLEFMISMPDGVAITEYQLIRLRDNPKKGYREFRTVTGGVFNSKSGAMRDMVPFEGAKESAHVYSVVLPSNLGAGEYGFIYLGATGVSGGIGSLSMGKMFTFHLLE